MSFYFVYKITKDYNFLKGNLLYKKNYKSIVGGGGSKSWMSPLEIEVPTS